MMPSVPAEDFIVIVAPCPLGADAREGWMSRIRAVDRLFAETPRVYVDPYSGAAEGPLNAIAHGRLAKEYRVDLTRAEHHAFLEALVLKSRFVYVHTGHLSRYLLPFYPTGKIVTDMHGIVPEEERMIGRQTVATFYEGVERVVVKNSRVIIVVTDAMRDHLMAKHPDCNATFICLPIIEDYAQDLGGRVPRVPGDKFRVIYAGGTQVWQNVDHMLDVCQQTQDIASFEVLSHEHEALRSMASDKSFVGAATFGVAGKQDLPGRYLASDFGFVLRDDTAVNRVSCPTKLSEYLSFGVIPIVKTPQIGDFPAEGYFYVSDDDFIAGLIPDEATCGRMRTHNRDVLNRLACRFDAGAETLKSLRLPNLIAENTLAGLPIGTRHLMFPSQAELYLFSTNMHHFVRDVIDFYDDMHWEPDVEEPIRALRLVPFLGDIAAELVSVDVLLRDDPPAGLSVACATTASAQGAVLRLTRAASYIDVNFSTRVAVKDVIARWRFHDAGGATVGARSQTAATPVVEVVVRNAAAETERPVRIVAPIAFFANPA